MVKRRSITGPKKKKRNASDGATSGKPQEIQSNASRGRRASAVNDLSNLALISGRVGRKRKGSVIESVDDTNGAKNVQSPEGFAAQLKPGLRYISQEIIKTKWEVLPEHMQQRVRELFVAAERPVMIRHPEDKKRIEAQAALSTVTRTLAEPLPRMPFPSKTKEEHFNYKTLMNKNLKLEHQLTLILYSTALLENQISKEERLLTRELAALNQLKRNAKADVKLLSRQTAKRPHMLQAGIKVEESEDNATSIGLIKALSTKLPASEQMDLDVFLQPLVLQLRGHLDSMETNAAQTKGLNTALSETAALLESRILSSQMARRSEI
ncbi:hypothetical protein MMC15_002946 [Xylographa vitiligo]|nr:hypothetical protein [Xylographa vitiligo]